MHGRLHNHKSIRSWTFSHQFYVFSFAFLHISLHIPMSFLFLTISYIELSKNVLNVASLEKNILTSSRLIQHTYMYMYIFIFL